MAKNTGSSKFRKVDVDQFDEDRFVDADEEADASSDGPSEAEINSLLTKDKQQDALILLLNNAPLKKDQATKDAATRLVVKVLSSVKEKDMDACIKGLDQPSLDVLMKYIYRGFEIPSDNSSQVMLAWHAKAFAAGGLGSIMRVMTDRKRV